MIGYLFMDTLDYRHLNLFNSFLTNIIYIILASLFVINSTIQFFVIYYMNKNIQRYYTMILSCIFDKIGSYAYFFGAIFTTIDITKTNTIWTFNTLGVWAFVIGATINLMIPGMSTLAVWADYLNLLGSLFYLSAILITRISLIPILIILGDIIYLIDSFLYMICWFQERKWVIIENKQYYLFK